MKSTYAFITGVAVLLHFVQFALAHGYVKTLTVDGKDYTGPIPRGKQIDSVIRAIDTTSPVKGENGDDIVCGPNALDVTATKSAPAKPGSKLTFDWAGGDNGNWPHNTGPILDYITSCNGDCSKFNPKGAKWIKIAEAGKKSGSNEWVQSDLFKGGTYSVNLPDNLPNGNYLVRHEIIGLHIASSKGGAEFYPSCAQITVTGGTEGSLPGDSAVSFPGAYSPTDPGILVDAFNGKAYQFPGGDVVQLSKTGSSNGNTDGGDDTNDDGEESSAAPRATSVNPDVVTVTATKVVTSIPTSSHVASTVTQFITIFLTETPSATASTRSSSSIVALNPSTTPAAAQKTDSDYYRIRRSRFFGRAHT